MDIQHCITTKKEKDLRFLESEKRGSNESFLFFMQKKDIQICSKCRLNMIIIDPLKYMHELLH